MDQAEKIIHARWIIPNQNNVILEDHAVVIDKGLITDILPSSKATKEYQSNSVNQYPNHVIIPGLINTHTHLAMNYLRGLADDLALMDWLHHHIWPAEKKWVSAEFVRDASNFAMAEMIRGGSTCFNDMYFFLQETAAAAEQAGIRAFIGMTLINFPTAWAQNIDEYFAKGLAFYQEYKNHPFITPTIAPHSIYTVPEKNLERVRDLAEKYNLKINMHVQETEDEIKQSLAETGLRPLSRLQKLGLVSPRLIAVHMTQIDDDDLEILQNYQPQVVHCPESNMKLASGACPVTQLKKLGINVALGTDGAASNNDLDMFSEMHSAALLAKLITKDPTSLNAMEAINMATLNGAKALGIADITGSLEKGKAADLVAINLEEIETLPHYNPASQIVYASSRQQVSDVWVAGKQLLKDRQLLTLDEHELKEKSKYWAQKISQ